MTITLQVAYVVIDGMADNRAFYEDVLGLAPKFADGDRWAQYDLGGTNFALAAPGEAPAGAKGAILVFQVDDLEAAMQRLASAGTPVEELRDMGAHGRVATFTDPSGNRLQLFARAR
jgi:predicted enzyme related to lactoylglutathione lyase